MKNLGYDFDLARGRPHVRTEIVCASRWLEDGLDVREIQLLLGHAKLEITQRYLNITDVGVVRSMRELWGRGRAAGRAQG